MNGYNFTERVRRALANAREEAVRLRHEYVGTEHILLGIIRTEDAVALGILRRCGVDPAGLASVIDGIVKTGRPGQTTGPDLPYTSRAKKVLELSMAEARELNHTYVGTEHLLLGLLREEKGIGAQVLSDAGLLMENARAEVAAVVSDEGATHGIPRTSRPLGASPWQQLNGRLKVVFIAAHDRCRELRVDKMRPVDVAIALLEHDEGAANAALRTLQFDRQAALASLRELAAPGDSNRAAADPLPINETLIAVLRRVSAVDSPSARRPGTEHLLLALVEESEEVSQVFAEQALTLGMLRDEIQRNSG